ncbi:MAG: hypothetical protein BSR46_08570 [Candidatus Dactylopiibacterium carminicum]|nr:MAG: hypothetical protein BSR46_08570 [Candidatus Dactylopiibacterium carminicum]
MAGALSACSGFGDLKASRSASACEQDSVMDGSTWCALAFGQSTDLNFPSTILPEKVGVNNVWLEGRQTPLRPGEAASIASAVTLESRGGKLANTHDGLTFYYTRIPTDRNFRLEADITVEQFGPEVIVKGAKAATNGQESAGLMVRDVIGQPRREPLEPGYEEFPAASNIVANAVLQTVKNNEERFALRTVYRDGVEYPWGNTGAIVPKADFIGADAGLKAPATFRMSLERTDDGFVVGYADVDGKNARTMKVAGANANIVQVIDSRYQYVGLYAARNARISARNIRLSLSEAKTVDAPRFVPKAESLRLEVASPARNVGADYLVQARASRDGKLAIRQDGKPIATDLAVKAGDIISQPTRLTADNTRFELVFASADGGSSTATQQVARATVADATKLFVAPEGVATANGTERSPLDINTALELLAPGGTLTVLPGKYPATTLSIAVSGSEKARKTLLVRPGAVFAGKVALDANYWNIKGIEVSGAQFRISGSHNVIENALTYGNEDTGLQISALPKERALWPSHNLVLNSTSHSNRDRSAINADGFAAKLGVGDGNVFRGCLSYDNADDGWDLFNKIEDGANGVVTIENSYAWNNGANGFKLGGEGQPVAHTIRNSVAFNNSLDGFTDNFNPGALTVSNNVSFNNTRFNYIFRPSPYGGPETQGSFSGNLSLRSDYKDTYDDEVVGVIGKGNAFIDGRASAVMAQDFVSVQVPAMIGRKADGSPDPAGFLQRR